MPIRRGLALSRHSPSSLSPQQQSLQSQQEQQRNQAPLLNNVRNGGVGGGNVNATSAAPLPRTNNNNGHVPPQQQRQRQELLHRRSPSSSSSSPSQRQQQQQLRGSVSPSLSATNGRRQSPQNANNSSQSILPRRKDGPDLQVRGHQTGKWWLQQQHQGSQESSANGGWSPWKLDLTSVPSRPTLAPSSSSSSSLLGHSPPRPRPTQHPAAGSQAQKPHQNPQQCDDEDDDGPETNTRRVMSELRSSSSTLSPYSRSADAIVRSGDRHSLFGAARGAASGSGIKGVDGQNSAQQGTSYSVDEVEEGAGADLFIAS